MLLPLEPLVDVALEPVVDVPAEPVTGALGATGALLGVVLPVDVLGGLPAPKGVTLGTAAPGTDARLGRCSLAFRLLLAGQTLLDIFGFLLARIKMQHRVALAPLFLHRVCVFCLGCLHRVRVFCFGRRRRWDR